MKFIGIDPGLSSTGIGIVTGEGFEVAGFSFGSINTPSRLALPNRLDHIYSRLLGLLKDEKPDFMVVEDIRYDIAQDLYRPQDVCGYLRVFLDRAELLLCKFRFFE